MTPVDWFLFGALATLGVFIMFDIEDRPVFALAALVAALLGIWGRIRHQRHRRH